MPAAVCAPASPVAFVDGAVEVYVPALPAAAFDAYVFSSPNTVHALAVDTPAVVQIYSFPDDVIINTSPFSVKQDEITATIILFGYISFILFI